MCAGCKVGRIGVVTPPMRVLTFAHEWGTRAFLLDHHFQLQLGMSAPGAVIARAESCPEETSRV